MGKKISKKAIKEWIQEHEAADFEEREVCYYLHLTDTGEVVGSVDKADESFIVRVPIEEYGLTLDEYQHAESPEAIYAHEVDGDPIFERVTDELYRQAAEYMRGII